MRVLLPRRYRLIGKKGEGTFSEVLKAQGIKNGKYVAIKCMKNHFDSLDQVNNLREIQALRRLSPHPGVIKLCEVLYDQPTRRLALVFELMDMNIYELIRGRRHYLNEKMVKTYMFQLLKSMDHMHRNGSALAFQHARPMRTCSLGAHHFPWKHISCRGCSGRSTPLARGLPRPCAPRSLPSRHQAGEHPGDGR